MERLAGHFYSAGIEVVMEVEDLPKSAMRPLTRSQTKKYTPHRAVRFEVDDKEVEYIFFMLVCHKTFLYILGCCGWVVMPSSSLLIAATNTKLKNTKLN